MENPEQAFSLKGILEIANRRKWLILIPFIASIFVTYVVYDYLPKTYKATTLILVQPQRVPTDYVRPTITGTVVSRLSTISQEILSRTRLEKVIQEFDLFPGMRQSVPMEDLVEMMRKNISVDVQKQRDREQAQSSFSISYQASDPNLVMMVANKLASLFIEENLKLRESQAEGTSEFIDKELTEIEKQLNKKDLEIRNYKERHMGNLPQQLDANLRTLDRLHQQLWKIKESLKGAEDRTLLIQSSIEQRRQESIQNQMAKLNAPKEEKDIAEDLRGEKAPPHPFVTQLDRLKRDLENAKLRYTENHPDIVAMKKRIAILEPQVEEVLREQETRREENLRQLKMKREKMLSKEKPEEIRIDNATAKAIAQYEEKLHEIELQNKRLKEEEESINQKIASYQRRVEEAPKKEEELIQMTRDYELLKKNYQSLSDKKIQSRMFENLERRQQGEQFKILDPARVPEKPFKPDFNRVMMFGVFFGLIFGGGLAYLRETWNQKFHTEAEIEHALGLKVIAVIPNLNDDFESKKAA